MAMRAIMKLLAGGVVVAAFASAVPVAAQYPGYAYPPYGYAYPPNNGFAYPPGPYAPAPPPMNQGFGAYGTNQPGVGQCVAAVQDRLQGGYGGYGSYGGYGYDNPYGGQSGARVLGVSRVEPLRTGGFMVHGVASSGRAPYGYDGQEPDLTWRCRTDYRGYVVDVDVRRAQRAYGYNDAQPAPPAYAYNGGPNDQQTDETASDDPYDYSKYGYVRY
jgi:hypothetical protein